MTPYRETCYFCTNAWGACTCTFPDPSETSPGFDFRDTWVTSPNVSVCGRFYVEPLAYYGEPLRKALPELIPAWRTCVRDPSRLEALAQS